MPRGVTPVRVRRRQSDAKWRASVAMCYNIMKNVIPNSKKIGKTSKRKLSKALTLKETERHIVCLERKLKELLELRAPQCGRAVVIENDNRCLSPATLDDIRHDFAIKQCFFFSVTSSNTGKKRYNVPSDIETSLENLSRQSCSLVTIDHKEIKTSFPEFYKNSFLLTKECPLSTISYDADEEWDNQYEQDDVTSYLLTPAKPRGWSDSLPAQPVLSTTPSITSKDRTTSQKTPSKACKKLSFNGQQKTPVRGTDGHSGFTPVKLPMGLDRGDPTMAPPTTPNISLIGSPFSCFSMPETPGSSCLQAMENFELSEDEDGTSLLCTESIDSIDLEANMTSCQEPVADKNHKNKEGGSVLVSGKASSKKRREHRGRKCRRRLDRAYGSSGGDQEVPKGSHETSCLEFDGYLLFYQHNIQSMQVMYDGDAALAVAAMWEGLGDEERTMYARLASLDMPSHAHTLSPDLEAIDLKPLHGLHDSQLSVDGGYLADDSQEVPDMDLPSHGLDVDGFSLALVTGYEDLGVFYTDANDKQHYPLEDSFLAADMDSQVVPDL
ncbi:uncharacterized protein LOC128232698 [Mya arenaria]|uniref:uncharacterized protein LOC128232698 n=1 Tax=Mya arenaria TaxID=6604 RepID=UPI0022E431EF|nr:uncharacterized protein LOC128232698 [Mya arenaria]